MRLLSHASAILRQLDVARQDLDELKGEPAGEVRIGMPRSITELIGVSLFEECGRRLPKVGLTMIERLSEGLTSCWRTAGSISRSPIIRSSSRRAPTSRWCSSISRWWHRGTWRCPPRRRDDTVRRGGDAALIMPTLPHGLRVLAEETAAAAGLASTSPIRSIPCR